jgi:hypothetical protein
MIAAAKQPVEYDGYYFVDVVSRDGFRLTIPARGYNLRSWINFEKSMGSQVEYRAVSEKVWMKTHWTQTPYEEEPVKKAVKKAAKKAPAKKAVKKTTKEKNVRSRKTTTTKSSST